MTLFTALGIIGKVVGVATATSELKVQTCSGSLVTVETQMFVTDARLQSSEMLNQPCYQWQSAMLLRLLGQDLLANRRHSRVKATPM